MKRNRKVLGFARFFIIVCLIYGLFYKDINLGDITSSKKMSKDIYHGTVTSDKVINKNSS